jgi:hypothetical protein
MIIEPLKPYQEENIFTQEEWTSIYKTIGLVMDKGISEENNKYAFMTVVPNNGFIVHFNDFDQFVKDSIRAKFEKVIGEPFENIGVLFARYTHDSGEAPKLLPHGDRSTPRTAFTFTARMKSTVDWDFCVEDECFDLPTNAAVWFSGTHQSHWRPDQHFGPDDYYDVMLCQAFNDKDEVPLTLEFYESMDRVSGKLTDKHKDRLEEAMRAPKYPHR